MFYSEQHLDDFHKRLKKVEEVDWVKHIYQTNTFAAKYFDEHGGYLEIEKANVRMFIPPGAVKLTTNQEKQLIYISLDPVNHGVKGKVSPVVECGPAGTEFQDKITISYPHCIQDISQWNFSTLTCDDHETPTINDWKDVDKVDDVESKVQNGRTIIKTTHFTRYATTAEPKNEEIEVEKSMKIGAFGKDHKQDNTTYQFRVRTWDGTPASTEVGSTFK